MINFNFSKKEIESVCRELDIPIDSFFETESERRKIIDYWKNANIVACPGSGKTTVLLAKLLLLSRRMPFNDGKGICVLTHTNVAIDEIKNKLGPKADILFKHPNFFGTIQSFVDKFLSKPAFANRYKRDIKFINSDLFFQKSKIVCWWKFKDNAYNKKYIKYKKAIQSFLFANPNVLLSTVLDFEAKEIILLKNVGKSKLQINHRFPKYNKEVHKKIIYDFLLDVKITTHEILNIISYDDAYSYAKLYYKSYPHIKNLFSNRFQFLFIDEMQDTQIHQINIINNIFDEKVNKQYYGDPDQAIFYSIRGGEMVWNYKDNGFQIFEITDSKRYGDKIAKCIFPFRKEISNLKGNQNRESIKPYIILYNEPKEVIDKFQLLIRQNKLMETENYNNWNHKSSPFNAIGFVGKKPDEGKEKLTIHSYTDHFSKQTMKLKMNFESLISYFQKRPIKEIQEAGTRVYYNLFINSLIAFLDQGNIKNSDDRYYTKTLLLKYLREDFPEILQNLRVKFFDWIIDIEQNGKKEFEIKNDFIEYFKTHLMNTCFSNSNKNIYKYKFVIEKTISQIDKFKSNNNIISSNGVNVKIGTIHSVKGETHIATLLLETYYKGRKGKNGCEGECFKEQFCGSNYNKKSRQTQFKTSYVALSRPSLMLCVALNKDRSKCTNCSQEKREKCNWEIIEL